MDKGHAFMVPLRIVNKMKEMNDEMNVWMLKKKLSAYLNMAKKIGRDGEAKSETEEGK